MATDIEVIVDPAAISTAVTVATEAPIASVTLAVGAPGPQGPAGANGQNGTNGSDASVTEENIIAALGYTPADAANAGNPFNQSLNTTDVATFLNVYAENAFVGSITGDQILQGGEPVATQNWINSQGFATYSSIPSDVSQLFNDAGYITADQSLNTTSSVGFEDVSVAAYETGQRVAFKISSFVENGGGDYGLTQALGGGSPQVLATRGWVAGQGFYQGQVPTEVSQLNNDSGFITAADVPAQVNSDWNATSGVAEILNKPTIQTFDQSLNTTDVATFSYIDTANALDFNTGQQAGSLGRYLGLPSYAPAALQDYERANSIFRSAQSLFFGSSNGLTWSKIMVEGNASAGGLNSGTLADARLSSNVSLDNQNNNFTAGQSITAAANTSALTASYSVTGANTTPLLDLSGTWNTTGIARGIFLNITDTASNSSSILLDLQTAATSRFRVTKTGTVNTNAIYASSFFNGGGATQVGTTGIICGLNASISWRSNANVELGISDLFLVRDAANTLAQRNGTAAQTSRIYGTYTDASNGRRLDITSTTGGIFTLTATGNGTGATGNLLKLTAPILLPASSVSLATDGDLAFEATSNTTLTIRYRGSDGTTRSAAITLA
jgi:hypothetical protein